ncbi:MAG: YfhO family protein [Fimbriimonadales bacterium]|nr:YfhO family protein [Fimbriimonadales bacterium]
MQRSSSAWALLTVAVVLATVPFLHGWLRGEWVFAPLKLLYHFEPWHGMPNAPTPPAWDVLIWDGAAQFYIWRDLVRALWLAGEPPLWNPYALCGTPLLANSQSAPLYPPHLLTVPLPTWLAVSVLAWFHVFWAGLGLGLWLRRRGLSNGAVVGMLLWTLSLFMVSWLPLSSVPATLSWFGWLLLGLEVLRERGIRSAWAFALPLGMMLLAGHLQFAFYGMLMSLLYALYLGYETRTQGRLAQYALAVVGAFGMGGLLAAAQLLPVLELSGYSHRQAPPTEAGYQAYVRNALPLFHLITVYFPSAYGNPRDGSYWGAGHYAELALSVGAVGWLLALMGVRRRGQGAFWLGIGLLALLIALGTPLAKLLYFYLPGFSATGSPARVVCLWVFSTAVLAAHGYQDPSAWRRALVGWGGLLMGALALAALTLPRNVDWGRIGVGVAQDLAVLVIVGMVVGLMAYAQRFAHSMRRVPHLLILAMVPLIVGASSPWHAAPSAAFPPLAEMPTVSLGERIAVLNTRWSLYEPPPARMPPNTPAAYRLHDVGGYDSLLPRHYKRFLDLLNGQDSAPPENGNMLFVKTPNADGLAQLRVRAVLTPDGWTPLPPTSARLQPIEVLPDEEAVWRRLQTSPFPEPILVYGDTAERALREHGRGSTVEGVAVAWQEYRATRVRLQVINPSQRAGWLLITDTWYPGWVATVNGKPAPLLQANGAFRAVPIPSGDAVVEMRFVPRNFQVGVLLTLFSVAVLLLLELTARLGKTSFSLRGAYTNRDFK